MNPDTENFLKSEDEQLSKLQQIKTLFDSQAKQLEILKSIENHLKQI